MKLLTTLMLLLLPALAVGADKPEGAAIHFDQKAHDFGTIAENGGHVSHEFEFTNTGDAPLMILNATASCGCTRPDFPKKPVKAGKKGKIKVTYLPKGRPGEFEKTVTVKTNAKGQKKVTLRIKGFVTPAQQPQ